MRRVASAWHIVRVGAMLSFASCAHSGIPTAPNAAGAVQAYVTTGDRAKLLERQPDLAFQSATGAEQIVVDDQRQYQEMVGFGAALTDASAWLMTHRLSAPARDSLLHDLFGPEPGANFSFLRLDMGASDFALRDYSYDDPPAGTLDPTLRYFSIDPDRAETIPILRRTLEINPHLAIMASPWSAPAWMKTTGSMIKGTLRPDAYDAYAEYFARFIEAYAAAGISVYALTVQNEPHFEPDNYPGMRLEPAARAEFVGHHLGPLLASRGLHTRILDWDHNWDQPQSPLAVLADSSARAYISGVAWHCYGGDVTAQGPVHDAHPDKDTYFTECSGGDWDPNFGTNLVWMARNLIIGSTRYWSRGVLMWNLALDENHGPHTGGCGNCRGVVTINSGSGAITRNEEYYAFAHASRFVRAGAHRVASDGTITGVDHVAFRNADGSIVLVVDNADSSAAPIRVRQGARAFAFTMPAMSVATFRWSAH